MGSEGLGPVELQQVRMVPYLTNRLLPKHPKMDIRVSRELRTHCEALECLRDGQPARCADLLLHRTKALETSATEGWKFASRQEIVREEEGLMSLEERLATAPEELEHAKLEGMRRSSSRGRAASDAARYLPRLRQVPAGHPPVFPRIGRGPVVETPVGPQQPSRIGEICFSW